MALKGWKPLTPEEMEAQRAENDRQTAHHEAAHAVVAHLRGLDVYWLGLGGMLNPETGEIDADEDGGTMGGCRYRAPGYMLIETLEAGVAGWLAEEKMGVWDGIIETPAPAERLAGTEGIPDDLDRFNVAEKDRAAIVQLAADDARKILDLHWSKVEALAVELLERRVIEGQDLKDALARIVGELWETA